MGQFLLLSIFLVFLLLFLWVRNRKSLQSPAYPPGPRPLPLIGNLFDIPLDQPWDTYARWSETYGSDVIHVRLPSQSFVVLNSMKSATDLLEKKSHIYSDRFRSTILELLTWDSSFPFLPYGTRWRVQRRLFHRYFNPNAVKQYYSAQLSMTRAFLMRSLESPQRTPENVRRMVTSLIFRLLYGMNLSSASSDDYVQIAERAVLGLNDAVVPGAVWVDFLPCLRYLPSWVPGNRTGQLRREYRQTVIDSREKPYQLVKRSMEEGNAVSCITQSIIGNIFGKGRPNPLELVEQENIAKGVTGSAFAGGADTSTTASQTFLLAMALYPEVQKEAQAELDRIVGPDRLPDYDDIESLVYLQAVYKETLRWLPTVSVSPHRVLEDDVYNGRLIPKGAIVIANNRYLLHDPKDFPDPETFRPERYIDPNGKINPDVLDPERIAYGFGRRICPGRHLARNSLLIFIASVLHVFNISAGIDEEGNPVELSTKVTAGLVSAPLNVPRGLSPRSGAAVRLIKEFAKDVEDDVHIEVKDEDCGTQEAGF